MSALTEAPRDLSASYNVQKRDPRSYNQPWALAANAPPVITSFTNNALDRDAPPRAPRSTKRCRHLHAFRSDPENETRFTGRGFLSVDGAPGVELDTGQGAIADLAYTFPVGAAGQATASSSR